MDIRYKGSVVKIEDLTPTEGNIIVRRVREDTSFGGIALPETRQEATPRAEIVRALEGSALEEGMHVYIVAGISVCPIQVNGEDFVIVPEDCVLAWAKP
jgi:co-chaperonin GroES (HSP10)